MPSGFTQNIQPHVRAELMLAHEARRAGDKKAEFTHLENAHVLGQASTSLHVRVHGAMLAWAWRNRKPREFVGQLFRIVGAATKTVLGWVPAGNTGGANVSPFQPMPIKPELAALIDRARSAG